MWGRSSQDYVGQIDFGADRSVFRKTLRQMESTRNFSRCLCGFIVGVRVVPRRTVVGDIDRRFDNLSGSHHQSHVNCVSSVYGIYVSGQLSRDVIGCFKSNRWLSRDVIRCWFVKSCCYLL